MLRMNRWAALAGVVLAGTVLSPLLPIPADSALKGVHTQTPTALGLGPTDSVAFGPITSTTGADTTAKICQDASLTTYNLLSLNGTCVDNAAQGILGGATADNNMYLNNKAGGNFGFRVAGAGVLTITAAGVLTDPGISSFKVSTAPVNKVDTTFATVTGLTFALAAGKTYNCRGHLTVTAAPAAGGIKVTLATTDTLTVTSMSMTANNMNAAVVNARTTATALASAVGAATATATDIDIDAGIVVNAAGTLAVQFAQNAASGTTTVGQNSTFHCVRMN